MRVFEVNDVFHMAWFTFFHSGLFAMLFSAAITGSAARDQSNESNREGRLPDWGAGATGENATADGGIYKNRV